MKYVIKIGDLYVKDIILIDNKLSSVPMGPKEEAIIYNDKQMAEDFAKILVGEVEELVNE
ncbi:MAG TPA: hypothetical protein PLG34_13590 [Spirochaetota bacterium]|nr:hypothetical protein [Spirochaetota bacterium]